MLLLLVGKCCFEGSYKNLINGVIIAVTTITDRIVRANNSFVKTCGYLKVVLEK